MDFVQLGTQLKAARKARGLSQLELAKPLGMSRATISAIESGCEMEIGVRKLAAVLQQVGLDLYVSERRSRPTLDDIRARRRNEEKHA